MRNLRSIVSAGLLAIFAASLAACSAGHSTSSLVPALVPQQRPIAAPQAIAPKCKGQKTTKQYASLRQKLSSKGGTLCIPAIGGFGGTILYPPAKPSIGILLTSSTKNYNGQPALGKGKALFYLQVATTSGTEFGNNAPAGGGLSGRAIVPGKTYTAFGAVTAYGVTIPFTPCYAIAKRGKYGGTFGGIGTLLKGQNVPIAVKGVIEIYSGRQASGKC